MTRKGSAAPRRPIDATSGCSGCTARSLAARFDCEIPEVVALVSLEIPEPGATAYQNLMRQNPDLTRSDATGSTLRPQMATITLEEIETEKRVR